MFREPIYDEPPVDDMPAGHVCCERCGAVVPERDTNTWPVPHAGDWETEVVCTTCRPRRTRPAGHVLRKYVVSVSAPWDAPEEQLAEVAGSLIAAVEAGPFDLEAVWLE